MADIRSYFHRTSRANAEAILENGFRDVSDSEQSASEWRGVWFSDSPTGAPQNIGEATLEVRLPSAVAELYYWGYDQGYSEYLIPAAVLNAYPRTILE